MSVIRVVGVNYEGLSEEECWTIAVVQLGPHEYHRRDTVPCRIPAEVRGALREWLDS